MTSINYQNNCYVRDGAAGAASKTRTTRPPVASAQKTVPQQVAHNNGPQSCPRHLPPPKILRMKSACHLIAGSDKPVNPPRRKKERTRQIHPPLPEKFLLGLGNRTPLIPLRAAAVYLGGGTAEVLKLIDDGRLHWAFDIAGAEAARREVRVARESLFEYVWLEIAPPREKENEEGELLRFLDRIVPAKKLEATSLLSVRQVADCMACTYCHVRNLVMDGTLRLSPESARTYHSRMVTRDSFVNFLRERRIT